MPNVQIVRLQTGRIFAWQRIMPTFSQHLTNMGKGYAMVHHRGEGSRIGLDRTQIRSPNFPKSLPYSTSGMLT